MSAEYSEQEQSLRGKVERSESVLEDLEADLRTTDRELEGLAAKHHQYEVLSKICRSLEELDDLGAADLFWDKRDGEERTGHLHHAHHQIEAFGEEIADVERRRESIIDSINERNTVLDYLHYDLRDVMEEEENRQNEWLVERDADALPVRAQVMPWNRGCQEDQRFRRSLATSVTVSVAIALLLSMVALPLIERPKQIELPERVAKLVRKERTPPPPVEQPVIPEEQVPEPEPELVEELPPEPLPQSNDEPALAEVEQPDTREQVKSKGILAFRDSFASRADLRPTAQLGSQARVRNSGESSVGRPERMMVTTSAPGSSATDRSSIWTGSSLRRTSVPPMDSAPVTPAITSSSASTISFRPTT